MSVSTWKIGQEVDVTPRTWPGINKPGGHGKLVKIHYSSLGVVDSLDIKYTLGNNTDTNLETDLVKLHVELDRGRRSRRSRDFLKVGSETNEPNAKTKSRCDDDDDDDDKENHMELPKATKKSLPAKKRKKPCPEGPRPAMSKKKKIKPVKSTVDSAVTNKKESKKTKASRKGDDDDDTTLLEPNTDIPKFIVTKKVATVGPLSPLMVAACTAGQEKDTNSSRTLNRRSVSDEEEEEDTCSNSKTANSVAAAVAPVVQGAAEYGGRKTLKNIYDGQVKNASNYINSLVGAGPQADAKPKKKAESFLPPPIKTAEQTVEEERCQEFGKHFSDVMLERDMEIAEDELLLAINGSISSGSSSGCKAFTAIEVDRYVTRLCDQEKVMKSDGNFYSI